MSSIITTSLQLLDQVFNFPCGFDVIASCTEEWWESYKFIQSLKIV
jgi:hypothetical protein